MAYLRSLDDQTEIEIVEGENLLIGRLSKCDLVIDEPSVSSQHARMHLQDGVLKVIDMGSTNGTRLNYTALIKPSVLLDGDVIEFGNVSFSVDGPELKEEDQAHESSLDLLSDVKPVEASQQLDATMSISISEEDLEDHQTGEAEEDSGVEVSSELSPVGPEEGDAADAEKTEPGAGFKAMDPLMLGALVSAVLLVAAGLLLFLHLWNLAPAI